MALQIYANPNLGAELTYQGLAGMGQGISGGINKLGDAFAAAMEQKKKEGQEADALRTLLTTSGSVTKDEAKTYGIGQLRGLHMALTVNQANELHKAQMEQFAAHAQAFRAEAAKQMAEAENMKRSQGFWNSLINQGSTSPEQTPAQGPEPPAGAPFSALQDYSANIAPLSPSMVPSPYNNETFDQLTNPKPNSQSGASLSSYSTSQPTQPRQGPELNQQDILRATLASGYRPTSEEVSLLKSFTKEHTPSEFERILDNSGLNEPQKLQFKNAWLQKQTQIGAQAYIEMPDGTRVQVGGIPPNGPTKAFETKAQDRINAFSEVAPLIADIQNTIRPEDLGVKGHFGRVFDQIAPQIQSLAQSAGVDLGSKWSNPDMSRVSHQTKVGMYQEAMLKLATTDQRIDKNDRIELKRILGGSGWMENYPAFKAKLNEVMEFNRSKTRQNSLAAGLPVPNWAKTPQEMKDEAVKWMNVPLEKRPPGVLTPQMAAEYINTYYPNWDPSKP